MLLRCELSYCVLLVSVIMVVVVSPCNHCVAAIDELSGTIQSPSTPHAAWGGQLFPTTGSNVLVGFGNFSGTYNEPVHLIDIQSSQIIQSYVKPAAYTGSDHYGQRVIQAGDHVLVSAFTTDLPGAPILTQAGAVHIFDAATGSYQRTVTSPSPESSSNFGFSMAPLGNLVAVGSSPISSFVTEAYVIDPSSGDIVQTLHSPTGNPFERFGHTISTIDGDVIVGAIESSHAYRFDGNTGDLKQTYSHPLGASGWDFGSSIISSGNYVIISALEDDQFANQGGAVFIYDADTGDLLNTLSSPSPADFNWFGYNLAMLGEDILLVTELRLGVSTGPGLPNVLAYDLNSGELLAEIASPSLPAYPQIENFGEAIADVGGALVIGAPRGNYVAEDGPLYVYQGLIPEPTAIALLSISAPWLIRRPY